MNSSDPVVSPLRQHKLARCCCRPRCWWNAARVAGTRPNGRRSRAPVSILALRRSDARLPRRHPTQPAVDRGAVPTPCVIAANPPP